MRVTSLVAAAGASSRFGAPKALLPFDEKRTFLARCVRVSAAAGCVPVITHPPFALMSAQFVAELSASALPGTISSPNRFADEGLTGSVRTVLELHRSEALIVWPVDAPFADVGLLFALIDALKHAPASVPMVGNTRGHPAAFRAECFELLLSSAGGPRAVLDVLADDVCKVPCSNARVIENVNTLDDYRRLFGKNPFADSSD